MIATKRSPGGARREGRTLLKRPPKGLPALTFLAPAGSALLADLTAFFCTDFAADFTSCNVKKH